MPPVNYSQNLDKWNIGDQAADYIYTGELLVDFEIPGTLNIIYNHKTWAERNQKQTYPLFTFEDYLKTKSFSPDLNFVIINDNNIYSDEFSPFLQKASTIVLIIETNNAHTMAALRRMFIEMATHGSKIPVIAKLNYKDLTSEQISLHASTDAGGLLIDGFGDGLWLTGGKEVNTLTLNRLSFGILQACRQRISKTEYISCPSCGRTLFDLQETTAAIRMRTDHLKGVKIAIMGCIVNGPGEMADADYGYVGSGPGKITLYKGKEVVKKSIATAKAVDALIDLIKEHGDWVEKPEIAEAVRTNYI